MPNSFEGGELYAVYGQNYIFSVHLLHTTYFPLLLKSTNKNEVTTPRFYFDIMYAIYSFELSLTMVSLQLLTNFVNLFISTYLNFVKYWLFFLE